MNVWIDQYASAIRGEPRIVETRKGVVRFLLSRPRTMNDDELAALCPDGWFFERKGQVIEIRRKDD